MAGGVRNTRPLRKAIPRLFFLLVFLTHYVARTLTEVTHSGQEVKVTLTGCSCFAFTRDVSQDVSNVIFVIQ